MSSSERLPASAGLTAVVAECLYRDLLLYWTDCLAGQGDI